MKAWIISTVGTSLLTNYAKSRKKFEIDLNDIKEDELLDFLKNDPYSASAETNSILRIISELEKEGINRKCVYIVLLASETKEGIICAEVLKRYFKDELEIFSIVETIEGLKYDEKSFIYSGIMNLLEKTMRIVREKRGNRIILNATGGFKAEMAYFTVLGVILGLEVYYIHEKFRELVKLPKLPVKIDKESLEKFLRVVNLFDKIKLSEVDKVAEKLGVDKDLIVGGCVLVRENGEEYLVPSPLYLLLKDMMEFL